MSEQSAIDSAEADKDKVKTIEVNGRDRQVHGKEISFGEVVKLAFDPVPTGENIVIAVTYRHAKGPKHEGMLAEGESVEIKNGTTFHVKVNNKS
ncbi:MAG TPA: multiubiquitin domain-containing protein [Solirubrobacterales bacterium]